MSLRFPGLVLSIFNLGLGLSLGACSGTPSDDAITATSTEALQTAGNIGVFGGEHAQLTLDAQGGQLDFDCAAGTITEPLRLGADGLFALHGTYLQGSGVELPDPPKPVDAIYAGTLVGNTISLQIFTPSGVLGPFRLIKNATATIFHCN
jgi:hypothetical protein